MKQFRIHPKGIELTWNIGRGYEHGCTLVSRVSPESPVLRLSREALFSSAFSACLPGIAPESSVSLTPRWQATAFMIVTPRELPRIFGKWRSDAHHIAFGSALCFGSPIRHPACRLESGMLRIDRVSVTICLLLHFSCTEAAEVSAGQGPVGQIKASFLCL
jgi:hypothetical protein